MFPIGLDSSNFADFVKNSEWLILFFAPWCPHCMQFMPTWKELATQTFPKFKLATVDWYFLFMKYGKH